MYAIQLPSGEFLDGSPVLSFELQNTVFSGSSSGVLPGSFSFPTDLPASPRNTVLLARPQVVQNAALPSVISGVWVYADGQPFFFGDLYIRSANASKITINVVANFLGKIRETKLNELDLGGLRTIGLDSASARATAKQTFLNPQNYDFIFLPVYNPDFLENPDGTLPSLYTNFYDAPAGEFIESASNLAATPFPKLKYLLQKVFESTEFAFENAFQTTPSELESLYFWNNRSIYTKTNQWGAKFNLSDHVAAIEVKTFLRQLASVFNLGLFSNVFSKTVRLAPLGELLQRGAARDWTAFAARDFQIDFEDNDAPDAYKYQIEADQVNPRYLERRDSVLAAGDVLGEYEFLEDLQDATPPPVAGLYYCHDRAAYYFHAGTFGAVNFAWQELGEQPSTYTRGQRVSGDVFITEMLPVWDAIRMSHEVPGVGSPFPQTPYVRKTGIVNWTDAAGDEQTQTSEVEMRLMFYRGTYPGVSGGEYPLGAGIRYLEFGKNAPQPFQYSLRWDGQNGIYKKFWQPWHDMLRFGKHVSMTLMLPITELVSFSFEEKIRVRGMDYFVKKLRVGKTVGRGRVQVEASLISVI